ncbi:uncharacterized protein LOC110690262 [Chenopodium quinoa]|uniref:uncharacterized protein LOC110690262 n=1 Tax=Chenopodium quinoa TaxID=63459 RepID=UPI000B77E9A6|nr:uncharacterized protein LOC110690262 [Chenopodium quinoa]
MGFDGLLKIGEINLPRQLAYWLMTRIDPFNCALTSRDGRVFRLSQNQVHWVLGIPDGGLLVPTYQTLDREKLERVKSIIDRYGKTWKTKSNRIGREFKTVFLLLALERVKSIIDRYANLVTSLTCDAKAAEYEWCSLVLKKLMDSVAMFARRFYSCGYASGCAGCLIYIVVMYLDRLDRHPVHWGYFPRLEVWKMEEIRIAVVEDRFPNGGDFGKLGTLDVAYGEFHPTKARDTNGPEGFKKFQIGVTTSVCYRSNGTRKTTSKTKRPRRTNVQNLSTQIDCIYRDECKREKASSFPGEENMAVMNSYDVSSFKIDMLKRYLK